MSKIFSTKRNTRVAIKKCNIRKIESKDKEKERSEVNKKE